jgi:hypothetical protein
VAEYFEGELCLSSLMALELKKVALEQGCNALQFEKNTLPQYHLDKVAKKRAY